jgi:exodeoxyribonuclease VII small subunit
MPIDYDTITPEETPRPDASAWSDRAADWSYEATIQEIEAITARIESGTLELADVFEQFSVAVKYLRECETFLAERQQHVDLLIETLQDAPEV